jgi:hypothetical protein
VGTTPKTASKAAVFCRLPTGTQLYWHHASKNTKYRVLPTIFNVQAKNICRYFYRWEHCRIGFRRITGQIS